MKLCLSVVGGSSLPQQKSLKYSLLHETTTNRLLRTSVNPLMPLIPSAPQYSSTDTHDLPSRKTLSKR